MRLTLPFIIIATALLGTLALSRLEQPPTRLSSTDTATPTDSAGLPTIFQPLAEKKVIAPPPLRQALDRPSRLLTVKGIVAETNKQRSLNDLPPLKSNSVLNQAAQNKLRDMLDQQYFGHTSPGGEGPDDMAAAAGYEYLRVGENLALGGFEGDAGVVKAWMESPGHRENILSDGFTEIGVAARRGVLEGQEGWLAVQIFALPASVCPTISPGLYDSFEQKKADIEQMKEELAELSSSFTSLAERAKVKIEEGNELIKEGDKTARETKSNEQARPLWEEGEKLQAEGRELRRRVNEVRVEYNGEVDEFNKLTDGADQIVNRINEQIGEYNSCISGYQ